jgi:O-antigen/teichoic acid export membrane protein
MERRGTSIADSKTSPLSSEHASPAGASDQSLIRSVAWNAAGDWLSQIFSWASFVVVMRLLAPADFGIAAMAVLLLPYLQQITSFGIPRAIVTLRDLSEEQLAQLNTVSFASGIATFGLAAAVARPFAAFFKTPRLAPVIIVACVTLIPQGLQAVSSGSLAKQARFRLLSLFAAINALVAAGVTLGMALLGFGYWALIAGNLIGVTVRAALVLRVQPCRLAWPHMDAIRRPIQFGWHVVVSLLAMNSYQRLDNLTAGRVLGRAALGFYGTAWDLANVPIEKVTSLVTNVVPTYLAAVQNDPAALRRYLRTLTETIALAAFPATVGLSLVARELVPFVFGEKWLGMVPPLEVLSFYAALRSIVAILPKVLSSVGNVRFVMWNDLAALVILPIAFYIGSYRGTAGIAWSWIVAYPLIVVPLCRKTLQTIGMKFGEYLRTLRPALDGTIAMILAVEWVKHSFSPARSLLHRLVIEVAVGAVVYLGVLGLLHARRMRVLIETARGVWRRRS